MMEFSEEEICDVFKLLSGVLHIGNIEFMTAGGAQITSKGGQYMHMCVCVCKEGSDVVMFLMVTKFFRDFFCGAVGLVRTHWGRL